MGIFYKDKSLIGLDIGHKSIKVMQLARDSKQQRIIGYGINTYDQKAIKDGVIVKPELLAQATKELFEQKIMGTISSRRVAVSVPVAQTYNRVMSLPKMSSKDLHEAVLNEIQQYIPVPIDDLYVDFTSAGGNGNMCDLSVVAAPKKIVDSYMTFINLIGLEPCIIETNIIASTRLVGKTEPKDIPTLLIDFGSQSVDMTIYNRQIIVTGTVAGGSDKITDLISSRLDVSRQVAHNIKANYGLSVSKKQKEITEALNPLLRSLSHEVKKMIRYYNERTNSDNRIEQIITMGGGANMPGLSEYLTSELRTPTRMCSPWSQFNFGKLPAPDGVEKPNYFTAAGLAMIEPQEIWQ